jgi:hypothetical protein
LGLRLALPSSTLGPACQPRPVVYRAGACAPAAPGHTATGSIYPRLTSITLPIRPLGSDDVEETLVEITVSLSISLLPDRFWTPARRYRHDFVIRAFVIRVVRDPPTSSLGSITWQRGFSAWLPMNTLIALKRRPSSILSGLRHVVGHAGRTHWQILYYPWWRRFGDRRRRFGARRRLPIPVRGAPVYHRLTVMSAYGAVRYS